MGGVSFHLGKPILVMLVLALISGAVVLLRPPAKGADLTVWVFAQSHAQSYRGDGTEESRPTLVELFEQKYGRSVQVKLINNNALNLRLLAMMDRRRSDGEVPDVVEIEVSSVGRYFRSPLHDVGFLPMNEFLERSGWAERIVTQQLSTFSKRGVLFGIPLGLHPVSITYRSDLFDEAGVDLAAATTWAEFQEKCLEFQAYWRSRGHPHRRALELPVVAPGNLNCMLLQRGINLVDDEDKIYLADPRVAQTLAFYVQCVEGPRRIAGAATPGPNMWMRDFDSGDLAALMTPDWRAGFLKLGAKTAAGKAGMMPLPRFDPTDAPTATWGGTMMGIPRMCPDPAMAWKVIEHFQFSPEAIAARQRTTNILPPVRDYWNDPFYSDPDPFYGGQAIGRLYCELAEQIPRRYVTPYTSMASAALAKVQSQAVNYMRQHGSAGLEQFCQQQLNHAADDLQRRIDFGRIEE
jgi:arabinosaccharide transport system substrate-binding protein